MNPARSNDDALLDRLRAGAGSDVAADPRLPLVRALVRAASEPPPLAVEQRHLAAISEAARAIGDVDPRARSNGRAPGVEALPRRVRGVRLARPLKLAALVAATALALTGVALASGGVPAPLRAALEEVGLLPADTGDDSGVAPRPPVGTASRRGPKSRCARAGDASQSSTPAWCRPPHGGNKHEPSESRARRSDPDGRSRSREPGVRRREGTGGSAATPADSARARREVEGSAPGRSGSSPSRRGYAPVGGGRGRSSAGRARGSGRGRSSFAPRGRGHSPPGRPARPRARSAPGPGAASRGRGSPSPRR